MATQNAQLNKAMVIATLALALQACGGPNLGSTGGELFQDVPAEMAAGVLSDESRPPFLRERLVQVDFSVLKSTIDRAEPKMRVNLFNDTSLEVEFVSVNRNSATNVIISGNIVGDANSAVTLVMNDGVLIGNVRRGSGENIEIRYAESGVHTIRTIDPSAEAETDCLTADGPPGGADDGGDAQAGVAPAEGDASALSEDMGADHGGVIRMLVAYTSAARAAEGGKAAMEALIQMGIADTNRAFADSGTSARVSLAGMFEVTRSDSGDFTRDLIALAGRGDGKWDEVHTARARLGADQVSLVGKYTGRSVAGIGYINASAARAFTVTRASAFGQYTFTHELGHNIGLNHSDGHQNSGGRFRTVMAYGSYPRIRRFSNPSIDYNGYSTGSSYRNSASIINRKWARMVNFMKTPPPVATAPQPKAPATGGTTTKPGPTLPPIQVPGGAEPGPITVPGEGGEVVEAVYGADGSVYADKTVFYNPSLNRVEVR